MPQVFGSIHNNTWDVPLESFVPTAKNGWIAQILFIISTCATKASILLFYRRMTKGTYNARWRYAIWAVLAFTFAFFAAVLVAYCFICQPLDAYWKSYSFTYDEPFTCINGNVLSQLVGALSILSDLYATLLPWCMLWKYKLDVPRKQRTALNTIFGLSLVVAGCAGGRLYYLYRMNHSYDTSWNGFYFFV
ncbi:uncharacterized protein LTR77_006213 [Saxophila tyrrhenica]|uniref:Rhodopsin domain-containing protein n=1 Tax=Saxophila tyrrhenica TaxID=1690608 RepID=A0AAV9PAA6_9PEZI|nr:hypothetical protein LTR77_006213 [Saxophila tyrrhenica]